MELKHRFLLESISVILSLSPILFAFLKFKSIRQEYFPLFLLIVISPLIDVISIINAYLGIKNLHLFNYYTIIEYILISLFYIMYFKKFYKPVFFILPIPVFFIVAFYDYKKNGINHMNNLAMSMECIVFIGFALFFYFHVMKNMITDRLSDYAPFWFNSGVLVYFLGNSLLFIFCNYLYATEQEKYSIIWTIVHSFFNIIYNILLSIGFWKIKRT